MKDNDREAFYVTWAGAWETCGKSVTEGMLKFAFECLKQYDLEDIQRAIILHIQDPDHGQFAPKPADIIRQIDGSGDERSLKAWTKVEQAIRQAGSWTPVVFDDAIIHACIDEMGGWMRFCTATNHELPFLRNEFVKRYRPYMQHPPTIFPAIILGEGGFDRRPILIGDKKLANRLMQSGDTSSATLERLSNKTRKIAK